MEGDPVAPIDVTLEKGAAIEGRVTLHGETMLPGVEVAAVLAGASAGSSEPRLRLRRALRRRRPVPATITWLGERYGPVDAPRRARVEVRRRGPRADVGRYDFSLTDGAIVRGRVTAQGKPIAGARVELLLGGMEEVLL